MCAYKLAEFVINALAWAEPGITPWYYDKITSRQKQSNRYDPATIGLRQSGGAYRRCKQ